MHIAIGHQLGDRPVQCHPLASLTLYHAGLQQPLRRRHATCATTAAEFGIQRFQLYYGSPAVFANAIEAFDFKKTLAIRAIAEGSPASAKACSAIDSAINKSLQR